MKIKLDENVHRDVLEPLSAQGHDVVTVPQQDLAGLPDADIAKVVQAEKRCLVTCDLDFADPRRYPPQRYPGLVMLRLGTPTIRNQVACLTRFSPTDLRSRGTSGLSRTSEPATGPHKGT